MQTSKEDFFDKVVKALELCRPKEVKKIELMLDCGPVVILMEYSKN